MKRLQEAFASHLRASYPRLGDGPEGLSWDRLVAENLLSPFEINIQKKTWEEARRLVAALFALRENPAYREFLKPEIERRDLFDPGNKAIMMSYDFHVADDGTPKLIEVNTNAAFMFLGVEMGRLRGIKPPAAFSLDRVREDILEELRLFGKPNSSPRVHIVDEKPQEQRLFVEFLVARELFHSWGWKAEIRDLPLTFDDRPDFVYNRSTDFYFENAALNLREPYVTKELCFSPHPFEYALLADKQRMIDWSAHVDKWNVPAADRGILAKCLPHTEDLRADTAEHVWSRRKQLFFKPKREFGSKKAFKGASVSRKLFDELLREDMVAQEYLHAPERTFETPDGPQNFKFDLRCYAYKGELQFAVARIYQGQVTNLKTPLGGFAPVIVEETP